MSISPESTTAVSIDSVRWLRGATPGPYSTILNSVPFGCVVPISRAPPSTSSELSAGNEPVNHVRQLWCRHRRETTFPQISSTRTMARPCLSCPVTTRRMFICRSVEIECIAFQGRERDIVEHALVRRLEDHARRAAGFPGLDPAQHVQAPAVVVLQAAEAQLGTRRNEVVALCDAELEELVGDLHAHQVRDAVLAAGRAAAVAEVAGERRIAAGAQLAAENVFLRHGPRYSASRRLGHGSEERRVGKGGGA